MKALRKLFGPSKEEIWRQLSAETGGHFVDGGFWKGDKVQVDARPMDRHAGQVSLVSTGKATVVYTRMRAPYVNPDGFRFTGVSAGRFRDLGKRFGMQDVEVGKPSFDRDFIIKGTDESKLRQLFANPRIRDLVAGSRRIDFTVKDDEGWFGPSFPEGVDELHFQVAGVIKDVERLELLYQLFTETLEQLCRMGSAYQKPSRVSL